MYPNACVSETNRLHSTDDLDLALSLTQNGSYDVSNPSHALLLEPKQTGVPGSDEELDEHFKSFYRDWLNEEVFQGRVSLSEFLGEPDEEEESEKTKMQSSQYPYGGPEHAGGWGLLDDTDEAPWSGQQAGLKRPWTE